MSDRPMGTGWWLADDGRWYPPEQWTGPPGTLPPPADVPAVVPEPSTAGPETESEPRRSPWDPPPDLAPVGAPPPNPPPIAAPVPMAAGAAGSGGTPSPVGPREQRRFRSGRGPRFSGRGVLGLFGLLGLLLTIGIMAVLVVKVLDGMSDSGSASATKAKGTVLVPAPPSGGADISPGGVPDAAAVALCQSNRSSLETAVQAYELSEGSPPPSITALITAGLLADPVGDFVIQVDGDAATVVGIGKCAGQ